MLLQLREFTESESGWGLQKIISLEIYINKLEIGREMSFYILLPAKIDKKQAC